MKKIIVFILLFGIISCETSFEPIKIEPAIPRIMYWESYNGQQYLKQMSIDGKILDTLAQGTSTYAQFSFDDSKIVFDLVGDIYLINSDGSQKRNVTNSSSRDFVASFSPDGSLIVFESFPSHSSLEKDIHIINADGTNRKYLTNTIGRDRLPKFLPDGSKIVFSSDRTGDFDIYTMNVDGSDQINLTNNPANDWYWDISKDGSKLLFTSERDGYLNVYSLNVDGSNLTKLTNSNISIIYPRYSPDAKKIVYVAFLNNEWGVHLMDKDGQYIKTLALGSSGYSVSAPEFTPDGSQIIYQSRYQLFIVDINSNNRRALTSDIVLSQILDVSNKLF